MFLPFLELCLLLRLLVGIRAGGDGDAGGELVHGIAARKSHPLNDLAHDVGRFDLVHIQIRIVRGLSLFRALKGIVNDGGGGIGAFVAQRNINEQRRQERQHHHIRNEFFDIAKHLFLFHVTPPPLRSRKTHPRSFSPKTPHRQAKAPQKPFYILKKC